MNALVSVHWLSKHLNDKDLVLLDASLGNTAQGQQSAYGNLTLPGARFMDLKGAFSDPEATFPNTCPSVQQFEAACQRLGIQQGSKIVIFDNLGIYSSPRAWWLFKLMGHQEVAVLDGGLPEWAKQGFSTPSRRVVSYPFGNFKASLQPAWVTSYQDVLHNITHPRFEVVDARSEGRFNGTAPEPRPQLQSGHLPHAVNIPYASVLENGRYKPVAVLKQMFAERCRGNRPLVFSCGSGLTACIVLLASVLTQRPHNSLYDGSWFEWATRQGLTNPST